MNKFLIVFEQINFGVLIIKCSNLFFFMAMTLAKDTLSRQYEVGPELMELGQEIPQDKTVGDCNAGKYTSLFLMQTIDFSTGKSTALY